MIENAKIGEPSRQAIYVAGPLRLDLRERRLTKDGVAVSLTGKPLDLLAVLMSAPQRLVTKEEIFESVWQGRAISEAVLTTAVRQIRNAILDDKRNPAVLETVHGKGYRFLLPVAIEAATAEPVADAAAERLAGSRRRARPATVAILALIAMVGAIASALYWGRAAPSDSIYEKSLAILSLTDLSADADAAWFAEGLTEEIVSTISKTPDLHVASRRASDALESRDAPLAEFRTLLRVAHVLEGSVRRADGRVRVTAQLVRTRDGFQLWAQSFDRAENDVITIQEEIAFEIARALDTVLDPEKLQAMVSAGTRSPEAYDAYLQGIAFGKRSLLGGDIEDARRAAAAYERARTIDPSFAEAHWFSAQAWFANETRIDSNVFAAGHTREERLARYNERVDAAVASARSEVDALKYRSSRAAMRLQLKPAHELMLQYLRMRPRDLDGWEQLATLAAYAGDRRSMARAAERIHTLSMESAWPWSRAVTVSVMAVQPDLAAKRAREQLKVSPDNATLNYQAQRAFIWNGDLDEARKALEFIRTSSMEEENKFLAEIRQACAEGRTADASSIRKKLDRVGEITPRWHAAQILGDDAAARRLLAPFDNEDGLPTLMQFLFQPTFEARDFPALAARLRTEGVEPPPAIATPAACKRNSTAKT